jgi:hypothetical protein
MVQDSPETEILFPKYPEQKGLKAWLKEQRACLASLKPSSSPSTAHPHPHKKKMKMY